MFNLKLSVPTYKKVNSWKQLDIQGTLEISSEVDSLSEGYASMKAQVDELLTQASAENRLTLDLETLERQCEINQESLDILQDKINVATRQLRRLEKFLQRLGIDPASYKLMISDNVVFNAATDESGEIVSVEAEVDPIPFDSLAGSDSNSHEF